MPDFTLEDDGEGGALALGAGGAAGQRAADGARLVHLGLVDPALVDAVAVGEVGVHQDVDFFIGVVGAFLPVLVEGDDLDGPETVEPVEPVADNTNDVFTLKMKYKIRGF